jgi:hypothetical protein
MRPVFKNSLLAIICATCALLPVGPADAAVPKAGLKGLAAPVIDFEKLQTVARKEGMPLATIRLAGLHKLQLASQEVLPKAAFLKRAGLLAFVVFKRLPSKVDEIQFTNRHAGEEQTCRIVRADFDRYLRDAITKSEYERRLTYHTLRTPLLAADMVGGDQVAAPPELPVPPLPELPADRLAALPPLPNLPALTVLHPLALPPAPAANVGAKPLLAVAPLTLLSLNYAMALGGARYDAYQLEYAQPVLTTLDLRPSVQIISSFSPLNFMGGSTRPVDGLSFACDLLGTTRQHPGAGGLAFEGGIGARLASLQGDSAGTWPALHLRVGARWQGLSLGMRYPLMHRDADPTGTWEATIGYSVPFGIFGSP